MFHIFRHQKSLVAQVTHGRFHKTHVIQRVEITLHPFHSQPAFLPAHPSPLRQCRIIIRAILLQQRIIPLPEVRKLRPVGSAHRASMSAGQHLIKAQRQLRAQPGHHLQLHQPHVAQHPQKQSHRTARPSEALRQFCRRIHHLPPLQSILPRTVAKLTTHVQIQVRLCRGKHRLRFERPFQ